MLAAGRQCVSKRRANRAFRLGKSSKDERLVELEIRVENQKGDKVVTGGATVALASRG